MAVSSQALQCWKPIRSVDLPPPLWNCSSSCKHHVSGNFGTNWSTNRTFPLATSSAKAKTIIRVTFRIHAPAFTHLQKNLHTFTSESWWATEKLYNNQLLRPKPSSWNLTFCSISGVKHTMICCGSTRYKSPRGTILGDLRCARSRHFKCPGQTLQEYNATNNWSEHQRFIAYRPSRTPHWDSLSQVCLGASNYFSNGNQVVGTWVGQLVVLFGSLVSPPSLKKTQQTPSTITDRNSDSNWWSFDNHRHWSPLSIVDWISLIIIDHWSSLIVIDHHWSSAIIITIILSWIKWHHLWWSWILSLIIVIITITIDHHRHSQHWKGLTMTNSKPIRAWTKGGHGGLVVASFAVGTKCRGWTVCFSWGCLWLWLPASSLKVAFFWPLVNSGDFIWLFWSVTPISVHSFLIFCWALLEEMACRAADQFCQVLGSLCF